MIFEGPMELIEGWLKLSFASLPKTDPSELHIFF